MYALLRLRCDVLPWTAPGRVARRRHCSSETVCSPSTSLVLFLLILQEGQLALWPGGLLAVGRGWRPSWRHGLSSGDFHKFHGDLWFLSLPPFFLPNA